MLICNTNADDDGDNDDDDDDNASNGNDGKTGFPFLAFSSQVQKESSCTLSMPFRTLSRLIVTGDNFFLGKPIIVIRSQISCLFSQTR